MRTDNDQSDYMDTGIQKVNLDVSLSINERVSIAIRSNSSNSLTGNVFELCQSHAALE